MEKLQKKFESLLNSAFAPYFWQSKCRVEIRQEPDLALVFIIRQGSKDGMFYFPASYAHNLGVLAEEVLKAWTLKRSEGQLRGFEKYLSAVFPM